MVTVKAKANSANLAQRADGLADHVADLRDSPSRLVGDVNVRGGVV